MLYLGHLPRYTMHVLSPLPVCGIAPQLECVLHPLPIHTSSNARLLYEALPDIISEINYGFFCTPFFPPFGSSVSITHSILPYRIDNYLFPSALYIT